MSDQREGYYQCLCQKGHLTMYDVYHTTGNELRVCSVCSAPITHQNFVDDSGGEERGKIDFVLVAASECHECGHTIERIYRLP